MAGRPGLLILAALAMSLTLAAQRSLSAQAPAPTVSATVQGGVLHGTIQAGGSPLPGVSITAVDAAGHKFATSTGIDGVFQMALPPGVEYTVSASLAGFATVTQKVTVGAGATPQVADFAMDLASRAPQAPVAPATATAASGPAKTATPAAPGATPAQTAATTTPARPGGGTRPPGVGQGAGRGTVARSGRGSQVITMQSSDDNGLDASVGLTNSGVSQPAGGSDDAVAAAGDSVVVSGVSGQTNALAGFSEDQIQQRIQDMQRQGGGNGDIAGMLMGAMGGGGLGGPGGGPGGGGPGGGGFGGGPGGGGGGGGRGGGGFGGGGGGGFGRGGFGRNQNANAWHGSFAYTGSDSALNATPFSVTGTSVPKPPSDANTLIGSVTGVPYLPGLTKPNPKQFVFLSVQETRNTSPTIAQDVVPTIAQRAGDLTGLGTVYDPNTGQPYGATNCSAALLAVNPSPTACIPQNELGSPVGTAAANSAATAAQSLLSYYPLPNITPTGTNDNFQTITTGRNHQTQVSGRYNRSFGAQAQRGRGAGGGFGGGQNRTNRNAPPSLRQSIAENFAYQHQASSSQSFSPLLGGKSATDGYNFTSSYTVGYGRLNSTASVGWNRSSSLASNIFTNGTVNPAVAAGIYVASPTIYSNPFYFGVPSVSLTTFSGLNDSTPSDSINQTITVSDMVSYSHKRHNMRFGVDFHRIHQDTIGSSNVLGSFTFSGYVTENPAQQACVINTNPVSATNPNPSCTFAPSGSSLADILLGKPQQTGITAGLSKIYLRGNSWDWYGQDDWRARSNLTLLFGLRWEYFSPYSEKYGHLVNLNVAGSGPGIQISNVCATAATGCQNVGTGTLVQPDKSMYSPRIGLAWQPKFKFTKNTVVRAGYGINYNTGQYATFAKKLAFQQPFALTQTNTLASGTNPSTGCTLANLSLANGFNCSTQLVQSNFGVDPNYRLGMVQVYNLGIQRTLPQGVVLNIDYTGAYAGNLDILRAPNRTASGVANQNVTQFTYEDSLGYQRSNALSVNIRNRMHKGIALGATYKYSHSIDDASSVGGSGNSIAQNDQNLAAEESNSSFDQRHSLTGNFVIEPPFGPNRAFLNKGGVWAHILDGYSVSGNFTFATGGFTTPVYSGTASEIASGAGNSLRPDRVAGQSITGAGSLKHWFNTGAFTAPAAGTYGNASRNSIGLPGTVAVTGVLSRTFSLGETRSLEARMQANNVFNTVQYSNVGNTINASTYGQVTGVTGMRSFIYTARFRF